MHLIKVDLNPLFFKYSVKLKKKTGLLNLKCYSLTFFFLYLSIAINIRNLPEDEPPDSQLMRLDNMLIAEGRN